MKPKSGVENNGVGIVAGHNNKWHACNSTDIQVSRTKCKAYESIASQVGRDISPSQAISNGLDVLNED